jgi:hypothetical protein
MKILEYLEPDIGEKGETNMSKRGSSIQNINNDK